MRKIMLDVPEDGSIDAVNVMEDMLAVAAREARKQADLCWDGSPEQARWRAAAQALRAYEVLDVHPTSAI